MFTALAIISWYIERGNYAVTMLSRSVNWVHIVVTRTKRLSEDNIGQLIGLLCLP